MAQALYAGAQNAYTAKFKEHFLVVGTKLAAGMSQLGITRIRSYQKIQTRTSGHSCSFLVAARRHGASSKPAFTAVVGQNPRLIAHRC